MSWGGLARNSLRVCIRLIRGCGECLGGGFWETYGLWIQLGLNRSLPSICSKGARRFCLSVDGAILGGESTLQNGLSLNEF